MGGGEHFRRVAFRATDQEREVATLLAPRFQPRRQLLRAVLLAAPFERDDVRLEIRGADLMALGLAESPRIGEILGELRRRKLNGELVGRDQELAAARELATAVSTG